MRLERCIAPNVLDSQFQLQGPNWEWAADFTYLWTAEGWRYVAVVIDLFSRKVALCRVNPEWCNDDRVSGGV